MVLITLRDALGLLIRLPVGDGESNWDAFRRAPMASPLVGYIVGALAAFPLSLPLPISTTVALYLATLYPATGVIHADGLVDLGDAAVARDSADRRSSVLEDLQTGVGGLLAFGLTLVVLALGVSGLTGAGGRVGLTTAVAIALTAEVGAKAGMAVLVCLGTPAHEGLDSALVGENSSAGSLAVAVACLPVVALAPVAGGSAAITAFCCGLVVMLLIYLWSHIRLGGVPGDLPGAMNGLTRTVAVYAGVVTWALS